jgi:hypothetical protein
MNSTDSSDQQDKDIKFSFQILGLLLTLVPLIVSEILPFCQCDPNGITHWIFLSISRMNTRKIVTK